MTHANFIHLRVHTPYSLLEGAMPISDIISEAQKHNMPALGITDTNNLFGALEVSSMLLKAGIQPIIGCKVYFHITDDTLSRKNQQPYFPLMLYAKNEEGYQNLMALVSHMYFREASERPYLTYTELSGKTAGLLALTGGNEGYLAEIMRQKQEPLIKNHIETLQSLFTKHLYIEINRLGMAHEALIIEQAIHYAHHYSLPLIATNPVLYQGPDMYEAHEALLCIENNQLLESKDRVIRSPHEYFKTPEELCELFADIPESISQTLQFAERCSYAPQERKPILPKSPNADGISEAEALRQLSLQGLKERLNVLALEEAVQKTYFDRVAFELETIIAMGFSGYFLIVADFIKWAKAQGIPVGPGRGSGAGSVVAWALYITELDPIRWGLLFERFLNPERVSMPDFDIDFCQDRRDEVIEYVQKQYGKERVAQIITFGKLQARAVLRDVGRVLGIPYGKVDRICRLVPNNPANPTTLEEAIKIEPQFEEMMREDEEIGKLFRISRKLEGLYRHASTHAAGVVIGDRPLEALIPLYRDPKSPMLVTQYNMKYVEKAGLVKFDFLGLKTLTVIANTVKILQETGIDIDINQLPLDDQKTYELLSRGEGTGVFQLEGGGVQDILKKLKPERFEDIIALVALNRPGPMDNIPKYIACKQGEEEPDYMHPSLKGILEETFGIMIYQEQVMQIAQVLSGYSLGNADLLRRAMGKKIKEEMEAQRKIFIEGAVKNGVDSQKAAQIFDQVNKFAGYGFNKSHAAAYALVSYQTAYLKANYPRAFFAALMNADLNNADKLFLYKQELDHFRITLLPPDINKSSALFTLEGENGIRFGLSAIKGVGEGAMQEVATHRKKDGPYQDIFDFIARQKQQYVNKRLLESLIYAGAFDHLHPERHTLFHNLDYIGKYVQAHYGQAQSIDLFAATSGVDLPPPIMEYAHPWSIFDKLQKEADVIGFYLSAHPLEGQIEPLKKQGITFSHELTQNKHEYTFKMAGVLAHMKERTSAKGNKWALLKCSDPFGVFEVVMFSEILFAARGILAEGKAYIIDVQLSQDEDDLRLTALKIAPIDQIYAKTTPQITLCFENFTALPSLKRILAACEKGNSEIIFLLPYTKENGEGVFVECVYQEKLHLSFQDVSLLNDLTGVTCKIA